MSKKKPTEQDLLSDFGALLEKQKETEKGTKSKSRTKKRKTTSSNTTFYRDQIDWLDTLLVDARKNDGKSIRRSELIRVIIDFAKELSPNVAGIQSGEEILERFREAATKYSI